MQDIRRITFSNHELRCAFEAFSWRMPGFLPPGKVVACTASGSPGVESEVHVIIEPEGGDPPEQMALTFRGTSVLQALIIFCLENNVALPREGRKAFIVVDNQATLIIELNLDVDLVFEESPMTSVDVDNMKD